MKFLTDIWRKFKVKPKSGYDIWKDSKYVIEHAFTCGGVDYYCFADLVNKPFDRALCAIDFYSELKMNCDAEYLGLHVQAVRKLLHSDKINVFEINKLNEQMAERVGMIRSPELIYKLASVVYFDKNENPTTYDFKYNQKKIERWKKEFPSGSFFFQQPIQALIPFSLDPEMSSETYIAGMAVVAKTHLDNLLSVLYGKGKSNVNAKQEK